MNRIAKKLFNLCGFDLIPRTRPIKDPIAARGEFPSDFSDAEIETINRVRPFTMTSIERIVSAIRAVEYTVANGIPGAVVECGVWRGGSMMAIALTLLRLGRKDTPLYLFDTFEGMSKPTDVDGEVAATGWRDNQNSRNDLNTWCYASIEDVRENLASTGYDPKMISFVKGKVEDTLPASAPESISLLRLDTDWYESTRHELIHLFPRLNRSGVIIIDDYGYWEGCRRAVDEYMQANRVQLLLSRIDLTGRIGVKL